MLLAYTALPWGTLAELRALSSCPSRAAVRAARRSGVSPLARCGSGSGSGSWAPAVRSHGVLHCAESGAGLRARSGRVAAVAQGLLVPREAAGAATGSGR